MSAESAFGKTGFKTRDMLLLFLPDLYESCKILYVPSSPCGLRDLKHNKG